MHIPSEVIWFFAFWIFSNLVQALPEPLATERWYGFLYRFLHLLGANAAEAGLGRFIRPINRNGSVIEKPADK